MPGRPYNPPQPVAATVGRNLHRLRTRRGLSMVKLQDATKALGYRIGRLAISEMEAGVNNVGTPRTITVDELMVLAAVLEVPVGQLLRPPRCEICWDLPLPGFICQRCGTPNVSASAGGP